MAYTETKWSAIDSGRGWPWPYDLLSTHSDNLVVYTLMYHMPSCRLPHSMSYELVDILPFFQLNGLASCHINGEQGIPGSEMTDCSLFTIADRTLAFLRQFPMSNCYKVT